MAETNDGEKKVKVKFLRDEIYETEGRNQGKQFIAGRVYSMTADQAGRWIRRDAAELVEDADAAEEDGPIKPRRGRPPKAKPEEGGGSDDDAEDDDSNGDDDPAPPEPPRPPMPPVRQPEPVKPKEPEAPARGPGPSHVGPPAKAPDKGR